MPQAHKISEEVTQKLSYLKAASSPAIQMPVKEDGNQVVECRLKSDGDLLYYKGSYKSNVTFAHRKLFICPWCLSDK